MGLPMGYYYQSLQKYLKVFNYISQVKASKDEFESLMLVDAIEELCTDIGIPENLTVAINNASKTGELTREEIESKIPEMVADAMKSGNIAVNPRTSTAKDIEMLYYKAL